MTQLHTEGNILGDFNETEFKEALKALVGDKLLDKAYELIMDPTRELAEDLRRVEGYSELLDSFKNYGGLSLLAGIEYGIICHEVHRKSISVLVNSPKAIVAAKWSVASLQLIFLVGQWYSLTQMNIELQKVDKNMLKFGQALSRFRGTLCDIISVAVDGNMDSISIRDLKKLQSEVGKIRDDISWQIKKLKWAMQAGKISRWGGLALGILGCVGGGILIATGVGGSLGMGLLLASSVAVTASSASQLTSMKDRIKRLEENCAKTIQDYTKIATKFDALYLLLEKFVGYLEIIQAGQNTLPDLIFGKSKLKRDKKYFNLIISELKRLGFFLSGDAILTMKKEDFKELVGEFTLENGIFSVMKRTILWNDIKKIQHKYKHCGTVITQLPTASVYKSS